MNIRNEISTTFEPTGHYNTEEKYRYQRKKFKYLSTNVNNTDINCFMTKAAGCRTKINALNQEIGMQSIEEARSCMPEENSDSRCTLNALGTGT
jgi:hypothetical protein